jgi:hypothetical protein
MMREQINLLVVYIKTEGYKIQEQILRYTIIFCKKPDSLIFATEIYPYEDVNPGNISLATRKYLIVTVSVILLCVVVLYYSVFSTSTASTRHSGNTDPVVAQASYPKDSNSNTDMAILYKNQMNHLINGDSTGRWTIKDEVPLEGAIFPYKRIVAYYGNLYSKQMGILGELPKPQIAGKIKRRS